MAHKTMTMRDALLAAGCPAPLITVSALATMFWHGEGATEFNAKHARQFLEAGAGASSGAYVRAMNAAVVFIATMPDIDDKDVRAVWKLVLRQLGTYYFG